ncbi:hypothetical protein ABBQ38_005308 [Trebouxia sp. C0009 RCD-2024]
MLTGIGYRTASQCSRVLNKGLHSQLLSLRGWHTAQAVATASQEQQQQGHAFHSAGIAVAGLAAGFAAATAPGLQSHCEASTYAKEPANKPWWSRLLHRADPRQLWQQRQEQNVFLAEMQDDPKVSVVLALALPFLSLAFGYIPAKHDLDTAADMVQANVEDLNGWEISSLLWAAARLGYLPADYVMEALLRQVSHLLGEVQHGKAVLGAQEASMMVWALAVLHQLNPTIWTALLDVIAAAPQESLDEVTLVHLYQAGMFADLDQISAASHLAPPASSDRGRASTPMRGAKVSAAEAPLREEVLHKLQHLPPALFSTCQQVYLETAKQAGFDGPYLIELTIMLLLSKVYPTLSATPAYRRYFHDLRGSDLARARQLTEDPYMLIKFKGEIADRRATQNTFVRQLRDISRTLKSMGLHHQIQGPVEDGLVHVDIALPDYKLALFLESAQEPEGPAANSNHSQSDGTTLNGYVANETPGTKQAKLQLLEQLGWKCYSITWTERGKPEEEKQRLLMQLITRAGQMHTMQGRMNSMVHGTLRTVGDEQSRFQNASVGYHLKRKKS